MPASPTLRRSGRAGARMNYQEASLAKRIRDESSSSDEGSDAESDMFQSPVKRKAAGRKSSPRRRSGKGASPTAKVNVSQRRVDATQADDDAPIEYDQDSLMAMLQKGSALQATIYDLIERYKEDQVGVCAEIVDLLFHACGYTGPSVVTTQLLEDPDTDVAAILKEVMSSMEDGSSGVHNPLQGKDKQARKFRVNFEEFWSLLIRECHPDILLDGYMLEMCTTWLVALSSSSTRTFRYPAVVASLCVLDMVVDLAADEGEELQKTDRHLATEKKKKKPAASVVTQLEKNIEETHQRIVELENTMDQLFKGVFVHRYRDCFEDIRALCISSLGGWIAAYPSKYLQDSYLKYIGWMLSDKHHLARLASVQTLAKLYEDEALAASMVTFIERFQERIVHMCKDKEPGNSSAAIHLLCHFLSNDLLSDEVIREVIDLVQDKDPETRKASGKFFANYLAACADSGKESAAKKVEKQLHHLVEICCEIYGPQALALYVVDALWKEGSSCILTNTAAMVNLLLGNSDHELEGRQAAVMCQILGYSLRLLNGENIIADDVKPDPVHLSKKAIQERITLLNQASQSLVQFLPEILLKYKAEPLVVKALVTIPLSIDPNLFSKHRRSKEFQTLLGTLRSIFLQHSDSYTLKSIAESLAHLAKEHPMQKVAHDALTMLVDTLRQRLSSQIESTEKDWKPLLDTSNRLCALAFNWPIVDCISFWEDLEAVLERCLEGDTGDAGFGNALMIPVARTMLAVYSWDFRDNFYSTEKDDGKINLVNGMRDVLSEYLENIIRTGNDSSKCGAFMILCHMTCLGSLGIGSENEVMVWDVPRRLGELMADFFDSALDDENILAANPNDQNFDVQDSETQFLQDFTEALKHNRSLNFAIHWPLAHYTQHGKKGTEVVKRYHEYMKNTNSRMPMVETEALAQIYKKHELHRSAGDKFMEQLKFTAQTLAKKTQKSVQDIEHRIGVVLAGVTFVMESGMDAQDFLEPAMSPFVAKMTVSDKKKLIMKIQRKWHDALATHRDDDDWELLFAFLDSVQELPKESAAGDDLFDESQAQQQQAVRRLEMDEEVDGFSPNSSPVKSPSPRKSRKSRSKRAASEQTQDLFDGQDGEDAVEGTEEQAITGRRSKRARV